MVEVNYDKHSRREFVKLVEIKFPIENLKNREGFRGTFSNFICKLNNFVHSESFIWNVHENWIQMIKIKLHYSNKLIHTSRLARKIRASRIWYAAYQKLHQRKYVAPQEQLLIYIDMWNIAIYAVSIDIML